MIVIIIIFIIVIIVNTVVIVIVPSTVYDSDTWQGGYERDFTETYIHGNVTTPIKYTMHHKNLYIEMSHNKSNL